MTQQAQIDLCVYAFILSFILFNQLEDGRTQMKIDTKQMNKKSQNMWSQKG